MSENPLVSIITVVYNGDKHLQQTIDSVAAQTYQNIEYIIVDGGSTDNTLNIIKSNQHWIAKWVSEKDKGIADAFNKGIQMAKGEIIGLANSDDWLEPSAIEFALKEIGDSDIVYGEVQFWHDEKPVNRTKSDHTKLRLGMTVAHPASFVRAEIYKNLGGFKIELKVAMDYELFLRFFNSGLKFKKVNKIFSNMRREGISDTRWLLGIKEELKIKDQYYNRYANWFFFIRQYIIFSIKGFLRKFNHI